MPPGHERACASDGACRVRISDPRCPRPMDNPGFRRKYQAVASMPARRSLRRAHGVHSARTSGNSTTPNRRLMASKTRPRQLRRVARDAATCVLFFRRARLKPPPAASQAHGPGKLRWTVMRPGPRPPSMPDSPTSGTSMCTSCPCSASSRERYFHRNARGVKMGG